MKRVLNLMLAAVALMLAPSLAQAEDAKQPKNIVETAVAAEQFNTLVAAVKAAGLADPERRWTVYCVCPHRCGFRQAAQGHGRESAEAREQREAGCRVDLPRRQGQGPGFEGRHAGLGKDAARRHG